MIEHIPFIFVKNDESRRRLLEEGRQQFRDGVPIYQIGDHVSRSDNAHAQSEVILLLLGWLSELSDLARRADEAVGSSVDALLSRYEQGEIDAGTLRALVPVTRLADAELMISQRERENADD